MLYIHSRIVANQQHSRVYSFCQFERISAYIAWHKTHIISLYYDWVGYSDGTLSSARLIDGVSRLYFSMIFGSLVLVKPQRWVLGAQCVQRFWLVSPTPTRNMELGKRLRSTKSQQKITYAMILSCALCRIMCANRPKEPQICGSEFRHQCDEWVNIGLKIWNYTRAEGIVCICKKMKGQQHFTIYHWNCAVKVYYINSYLHFEMCCLLSILRHIYTVECLSLFIITIMWWIDVLTASVYLQSEHAHW